jgi:hypothetical protein
MQRQRKRGTTVILAFSTTIVISLACNAAGSPTQSLPPPITQVVAVTQIIPITQVVSLTQIVPAESAMPPTPGIILSRLSVSFLGADGHKVIGTGCPGTDGKGSIVDYHIIVSDIVEGKNVQRMIVAGDNSTLTWEWPCHSAWALAANDRGNGIWDLFLAPSSPSQVYTVMAFYEDNTFSVGMVITR